MFEIVRRDGLARIGKFTTKSGKTIETPALLPVVNPKIRTVPPRELYDTFGFRALITNSYIIRNTPALKEEAQAKGLHELLDFPGVIMTDSGTFQSHMYGEVEVTNEEIVEFQKSIGTDIGTVLDIFTEPDWSHEKTKRSLETTLERTKQACDMKGDMMINGVVQGSIYTDLREYSARAMADMDVDVHPVGGVVPLMEQYRYAELVDVVMSSKKGLNPSRPVHLFGCGHPMLLALATLMGCDLFDSASYALYARDDRLMDVTGTHRLQDMQSLDCNCPACRGITIEELRRMDKSKRSKLIAEHNLYQITQELATVRREVHQGGQALGACRDQMQIPPGTAGRTQEAEGVPGPDGALRPHQQGGRGVLHRTREQEQACLQALPRQARHQIRPGDEEGGAVRGHPGQTVQPPLRGAVRQGQTRRVHPDSGVPLGPRPGGAGRALPAGTVAVPVDP